jgi:RNA polymerase sigma-70 factor (sigma-E family)
VSDDEFTAFVRTQWVPLVRSLVFLGVPMPDAEDVVQTALMRVHRHWGRVSAADDPVAYAFRVTLNALTRSRERRWSGEIPTAELPTTEQLSPLRVVDDRDELLSVLAPLRRDHQEVLVLRYVADLTEAQTAAALGVPIGTVKSRTARALDACQRSQQEAS